MSTDNQTQLEEKSTSNKFIIPIDEEVNRFESFLQLPLNERIIFSGIFGSGKTYFLNEFFKGKEHEYLKLHLYPTNYSVASTEDIFEYIKVDILYELLSFPDDIELKLEDDKTKILATMSKSDWYDILKPFVKMIPEIGKPLVELTDTLRKLIEKNTAISRGTNEGEKISQFFKQFEIQKGGLYEGDFHTQLIIKLIERLKENTGKQVVLIIDDTDRIDPEHIFRILNVFAVHFDVKKSDADIENKFGLDKIVLVCDVDNIRSIFKAKYGQSDFSGYIDKFYSTDIYRFDNTKIVSDSVKSILRSIRFKEGYGTFFNYPQGARGFYFDIIPDLISSLVISNSISLRSLVKLWKIEYTKENYVIRMPSYRDLNDWNVPLFQIFDFLCYLKGGHEAVSDCLNDSSFRTRKPNLNLFLQCVMVRDFSVHLFQDAKEFSFQYKDGQNVKYQIFNDSSDALYVKADEIEPFSSVPIALLNRAIVEAFDAYVLIMKNYRI